MNFAAVEMRLGEPGFAAQRIVELRESTIKFAQQQAHEAAIVIGVGAIRVDPYFRVVISNRLLEVPQRRVDDAAVMEGVGECFVERERLIQVGESVVESAQGGAGEAAI